MSVVLQGLYEAPSFLKHIISVSGDRVKFIFGATFKGRPNSFSIFQLDYQHP